MKEDRIVQQLDKMVQNGRVTDEEAKRLRAAQGTPAFDLAIRDLRARHAAEELDAAVRNGAMTREDADNQLDRIRGGEHPKGLRARLRMHRDSKGHLGG